MENINNTTKKYTSRERALESIEHREPDRVPVDLGGTVMSGIMAHALDRLRKYLKLFGQRRLIILAEKLSQKR